MRPLLRRLAGDQTPGEREAGDEDAPTAPAGVITTIGNSLRRSFRLLRTASHKLPTSETVYLTLQPCPAGSSPDEATSPNSLRVSASDTSEVPRPVNDERPSALASGADNTGPRDNPTSTATPAAWENDRRRSFDPLARYHSSSSHSFPDYGHLKSAQAKMVGNYGKRVNDAFSLKPANTMSAPRPTQATSWVRESGERPAAKRQRKAQGGQYTHSRFGLVDDDGSMAPQHQAAKTEQLGSQSHISNGEQRTAQSSQYRHSGFSLVEDVFLLGPQDQAAKTERSGSQSYISNGEERARRLRINEYHKVEGFRDPTQRRSRARYFRGQHSAGRLQSLQPLESMDDRDAIQDVDDEYSSQQPIPRRATLAKAEANVPKRMRPREMSDSADLQIVQQPKPDFSHTLMRTKRRIRQGEFDGERDELGDDSDYDLHAKKKINTGSKPAATDKSSSISTRGDLPSSLAWEPTYENPVYDEGLLLRTAVWGPDKLYECETDMEPSEHDQWCVLKASQDGPSVVRLFGADEDGKSNNRRQHHWLELESTWLERGKFNHENCLVRLSGPFSVGINRGSVLFLEFSTREDTEWFTTWIRENSNVRLEPAPGPSITKEFENALEKMRNFKASKAPKASRPGANDLVFYEKREEDRQARQREELERAYIPQQASRLRLTDDLSTPPRPQSAATNHDIHDDFYSLGARPRRELRSHARSPSPSPVPILERWTEVNPDWDKDWRLPLSYQRNMVDKSDVPRLDEGECLNDNIIMFYLRHLQAEVEAQRPETAKRIFFHNSWFYSSLKPTSGREINYDGVKNWTAKVDLFSYDYIIVPVNEHFHWWVAIICNPGKTASTADEDIVGEQGSSEVEEVPASRLNRASAEPAVDPADGDQLDTSDVRDADTEVARQGSHVPDGPDSPLPAKITTDLYDVVNIDDDLPTTAAQSVSRKSRKSKRSFVPPKKKYNPQDPRIITLDSLGASHSPVCTHLKHYLIAEAKDKKNREIEYDTRLGMRAVNIPEQNNFCDCGLYLLGYVAEFLNNPDKFVHGLLQKEDMRWQFNASEMRNKIRQLIFDLHRHYQEQQEEIKRQKSLAKQKSRSQSKVTADGSTSPRSRLAGESAQAEETTCSAASTARQSPVTPTVPETRANSKPGFPGPASSLELVSAAGVSPGPPHNGSPQPAGSATRAFHVPDDEGNHDELDKPASPQLGNGPQQHSQLLPSIEQSFVQPVASIEIVEVYDGPSTAAHPSQSSLTQRQSVDGEMETVEELEDDVVMVDQHVHGHRRPASQGMLEAATFYGAQQEQARGPSTKTDTAPSSSSPPRGTLGEESSQSRYFPRRGGARSRGRTYGRQARGQQGNVVDLTND